MKKKKQSKEVIAVFKADTKQFKKALKEIEALLIRINKLKLKIKITCE